MPIPAIVGALAAIGVGAARIAPAARAVKAAWDMAKTEATVLSSIAMQYAPTATIAFQTHHQNIMRVNTALNSVDLSQVTSQNRKDKHSDDVPPPAPPSTRPDSLPDHLSHQGGGGNNGGAANPNANNGPPNSFGEYGRPDPYSQYNSQSGGGGNNGGHSSGGGSPSDSPRDGGNPGGYSGGGSSPSRPASLPDHLSHQGGGGSGNRATRYDSYPFHTGTLVVEAINRGQDYFWSHYNEYNPHDSLDLATPFGYCQNLASVS